MKNSWSLSVGLGNATSRENDLPHTSRLVYEFNAGTIVSIRPSCRVFSVRTRETLGEPDESFRDLHPACLPDRKC